VLHRMSPRSPQRGHCHRAERCLLSRVKRTSPERSSMSANDPKRTLGSPKSPNGTLWNVGSDHSGLMLANLITLAHFLSGAALAANPTPISEIAIYEVSHCGSGCRGTTGLVSPAGNTILKTDPRSAAERAKRRPL